MHNDDRVLHSFFLILVMWSTLGTISGWRSYLHCGRKQKYNSLWKCWQYHSTSSMKIECLLWTAYIWLRNFQLTTCNKTTMLELTCDISDYNIIFGICIGNPYLYYVLKFLFFLKLNSFCKVSQKKKKWIFYLWVKMKFLNKQLRHLYAFVVPLQIKWTVPIEAVASCCGNPYMSS